MHEPERIGADGRPPLILRRMPPERRHHARSMTGADVATPSDTWWELVDAAQPDDLPPAAVALIQHATGETVHIRALGTHHALAGDAAVEFLQAMVAFLRGHAVDTVYVGATDPAAVSSLLALGFHRAAEAGCFVLVL